MTALKPIENRRVRGVAAESYPSNLVCAHPDCSESVQLRPDGTPTVHHIFPRSQTKSSSYFVEISTLVPGDHIPAQWDTEIVPHAVGLCGSGTTGHHGDVEEHRAWIKLEDGVFVYYDRVPPSDAQDDIGEYQQWVAVGPLNPQPGSRDGKSKRKRLKGDARAQRKTISFRVPDDAERGSEVFDTLLESCKEQLVAEGLKGDVDELTTYVALTAVMGSWLQS